MRIAIIGQQAFGKAVLDAFLARGDTVAGVFVAPEPAGARPDPLAVAARDKKLPVFPTASYSTAQASDALRGLAVDLAVMAYVLQFVPQSFCRVPRHGTIQFHPSLLPQHRGPSSINWPVMLGKTQTGLTIFRPVDGLDEGPVILQKEVAIGPDDTVASLYFDKIFPLGVAALVEAADLVVSRQGARAHPGREPSQLRGLGAGSGVARQLGESRRYRLQSHSRLQPGPGRLDNGKWPPTPYFRVTKNRRAPICPGQRAGTWPCCRHQRSELYCARAGRLHRGVALPRRRWQEDFRRRSRHRCRFDAGRAASATVIRVQTLTPPALPGATAEAVGESTPSP